MVNRRLDAEGLEPRLLLAGDVSSIDDSTPAFVSTETHGGIQNVVAPLNAAAVDSAMAEGEGEPASQYSFRYDVNADESVTPIDAVLVINELNANGAGPAPTHAIAPDIQPTDVYSTSPAGAVQIDPRLAGARCYAAPFVDVNGDGNVSPIDALHVINRLNSKGAGPLDSDELPAPDGACPADAIQIVQGPANGIATIDNGVITYEPQGYVGDFSFQYSVGGAVGTISGTSLPNSAPIVFQLSLDVDPGSQVQFNPLTGDPDGDSVVVSLAGDPAFGTVTVDANGVWTYMPNQGVENVMDNVPVLARDTKGGQSIGFVQMNVGEGIDQVDPPVDSMPDAQFDTTTGVPVEFDLGISANGTLRYTIEYAPQNGAIELNSDGHVRYTSVPGYTGTDVMVIRADLVDTSGTVLSSVSARRFVNVSAGGEGEGGYDDYVAGVDKIMGQL